MPLSTFSIVAFDAGRQEWGVATQSKFLAVGAVVPWARAGAGAIATQSYANTRYGPEGLALLAAGATAEEALARLLAGDEGHAQRQVGIVDAQGGSAAYTGAGCHGWAGHLTGLGFACQGNILVDARTVQSLAEGFTRASGELADRLVAALLAGQAAGGDRRGQQAAAVLVVRVGGGYAGLNDRYLDLRVDDDPRPIERLRDLVELHHLYFGSTPESELVAIDPALARELQRLLISAGQLAGKPSGRYDVETRTALETLFGIENLEDRWQMDDRIDPVALDFLRKRFASQSAKVAGKRPASKRPASKRPASKRPAGKGRPAKRSARNRSAPSAKSARRTTGKKAAAKRGASRRPATKRTARIPGARKTR